MRPTLIASLMFAILLLSPQVTRGSIIYLAGDVLDAIDMFKVLLDDIDNHADNEKIKLDLLTIWALIDKLSADINIYLHPQEILKLGNESLCYDSAYEISKMIEKVATSEHPTITAGIETMTLISGHLPQAILHC